MQTKQAGFTLLELIVVMVIIAGAAALVATGWSRGAEQMTVREAAASVASALNQARNEALRTNRRQSVALEDIAKAARFRGLELQSTTAVVRFEPDGSAEGARIILRDETPKYRIDVDWLTGAVTLAAL